MNAAVEALEWAPLEQVAAGLRRGERWEGRPPAPASPEWRSLRPGMAISSLWEFRRVGPAKREAWMVVSGSTTTVWLDEAAARVCLIRKGTGTIVHLVEDR